MSILESFWQSLQFGEVLKHAIVFDLSLLEPCFYLLY
jgi:hypothetical protein